MDRLLTASMPASGRLHAAADTISLCLLVASCALLLAAALYVDGTTAFVPEAWQGLGALPLHGIAGVAALMLALQACAAHPSLL